tara:strand:+ start:337 stop:1092 length:756 start_codon:yes stop_codon:yes gene_type:complete
MADKNILITFGCSWTFGVGATYMTGMSQEQFERHAWDEYYITQYTFRKIISDQLGCEHINFAEGGSSNQRQLRLAREFFLTKDEQWFADHNVTVLWGLTSIYRTEYFNIINKEYDNFFLTVPKKDWKDLARILLEKYFSEDAELENLTLQMKMFDNFFAHKGIKNYWFNTFNPHQYTLDFKNLLFDGHDLLSLLIKDYVNNDKYHISDWGDTDRKIQSAKEQGLVNPISLHPTRKAHKIIANLLLENLSKT